MSMFSQPSGGGGFFKPAEHENHLVLITNCHSIEDRYDTFKGKEIPSATCDIVDLDDPAATLRERILVTHSGIVNRLSPGAHMVLGRIGKAPTKSGFEAWVLGPFTEGVDDTRAEQWVMNSARPTMAQPVATPAPQQAPAPAPAPAASAPAMADPNDPAVQALLADLQKNQ